MTSTNKIAKTLSRQREDDFVVQANEQTAGRGRKERTWESPPGGLYFSIFTDKDSLLPFRASIAVADILNDLDVSSKLKWPNDVLVGDRKICGILVESTEEKAVIGIGINVESAPLEDSTCLSDLINESIQREALMKDILSRFYESDNILNIYKRYCTTIGKRVKIRTIGGELTGLVVDIDEKGRLILEDGKKIVSGDVVHLRKDHV